ncbi:hypothetical protein NSS79_10575 [Paenibacillus sp. FSL L8-0436]|uniref:hypothetical protein n=1 Tax=Paenibacillus sp. FSL L8-0436 TaxID=2954686 RepID=UPI00315932B7
MTAEGVREAYRAGYAAGYMYGRIDAINGAAYDDRTPLTKREDTEVRADDVDGLFPAGRTLSIAG